METKTKLVSIENANQHPEFICNQCVHMFMDGDGGYAENSGQYEFYFMACKKQPNQYGYFNRIDAEMDGPYDENNMTDIIVSCDQYQQKKS